MATVTGRWKFYFQAFINAWPLGESTETHSTHNMKIIIILLAVCFIAFFLWYLQKRKTNAIHKIKPVVATEKPVSDDFIDKLVNSDYAKRLDSLKTHVKGHKVINSNIGNAGFILSLDNNCWASAFRIDNSISFEYGKGVVPQEAINKINSSEFGDATESIIDDKPYANERNNMNAEIRKSHGKIIEGLSIGDNTFNFAFENGMELDFQLCNDKNNKPAIRVFWEQW